LAEALLGESTQRPAASLRRRNSVTGVGVTVGVMVGVGPVGVGPVGVGDGVESPRVGVCQSRHSDRLPLALDEILIAPAALPVFSRNFWMFCCSGVRHSDLLAQWLPSWTSDQ
jgi:hypothetical protein